MSSWVLLLVAAGFRTLVLPFENVGAEPADDWKGSAFEETISIHLELAGHDVVDLQTRNRELVELGFVPGEPISRATAIVLGKALEAERLVVGAFRATEEQLIVEARVVDLEQGATVGIVEDYAPNEELVSLSNQVAKNLFRLEAHAPPSGFEERATRREKLSLPALEASARARVSADPDEQRRRLEEALEQEPDYLAARLMLGRLLVDAGEPRAAIDVLVGAGEAAARHREAYFDLGLAYLEVDDPESALKVFGSLTSVDAMEAASYNNQGVALLRLERFLPAIDAFEHAVEASPDNGTYHFNLGWALWRYGKGADALEQLEAARERMPWDAETHLLLSAALAAQARAEEADRARGTALLLAPRLNEVDPSVVTGWGRTAEAREPEVALDVDLQEAEDVVALVEIFDVRALRARGQLDDAIQLLQKSLYREPGALELRRELVELYRETGALQQAARELSMLLWTEPTVEAHLDLAEVYMELKEPLKAFAEVEKALELEPGHPKAREMREELTPPVI